MADTRTVHGSVDVPDDLYRLLTEQAQARGVSVAELVAEALAAYVEDRRS